MLIAGGIYPKGLIVAKRFLWFGISPGSSQAMESTKGLEHLPVRVMGVTAAGIRQQVQRDLGEPVWLETQRKGTLRRSGKERAIDSDSQQGHQARANTPDRREQAAFPLCILAGCQPIDAPSRAMNDIGEPKPPVGQPSIVLVCERSRNQTRVAQEFPEAVGRAGKVMPNRRRCQPRIDADKEDHDTGPKAIRKGGVGSWAVRTHHELPTVEAL